MIQKVALLFIFLISLCLTQSYRHIRIACNRELKDNHKPFHSCALSDKSAFPSVICWGCADFPKPSSHLNILYVSSATFSQFHPDDQHITRHCTLFIRHAFARAALLTLYGTTVAA
jgi:hypothetical protein